MVEFQHPRLSIVRQCQLLKVSRTSVYYQPKAIKQEDLDLMRLIDEQYLKTPTSGSRTMTKHLQKLGYKINRKRVQRLMRTMGLEAIYPKPKTSKRNKEHRTYPYLLRNMQIDRPNQVWCSDITYCPMAKGFMYLVVVMDWYSRKILSWRLSNTLDSSFCVDALEDAIHRFGCPQIFNSDQGSQYTSDAFTNTLQDKGIKISMDGRGRFLDNIFVERFWWTLKYHFLYLRAFTGGADLRHGLREWIAFYNKERSHQSLGHWTPDEIYYKKQKLRQAA